MVCVKTTLFSVFVMETSRKRLGSPMLIVFLLGVACRGRRRDKQAKKNKRPTPTGQAASHRRVQVSRVAIEEEEKEAAFSDDGSLSSGTPDSDDPSRRFACSFDDCDKVFVQDSHRRRHELSVHVGEKYPCWHPGCPKV